MGKLRVTRKVLPDTYGSVKETRIYGDRLMSVRYHKDDDGNFYKTAEIIVYERHTNKSGKYMNLSGM